MKLKRFKITPFDPATTILIILLAGLIMVLSIYVQTEIFKKDISEPPQPELTERAAVSTSTFNPNSLEALVNAERTKAGKQPFTTSDTLRSSACAKADHMLAQDYWAHTSPDGMTPWTFIEKAGYRYTTAGENLAKSYPDDASLVAAWMHSPSHRENVLGDFKEQGICQKTGMLQGKTTTVTVQHVGVRS